MCDLHCYCTASDNSAVVSTVTDAVEERILRCGVDIMLQTAQEMRQILLQQSRQNMMRQSGVCVTHVTDVHVLKDGTK